MVIIFLGRLVVVGVVLDLFIGYLLVWGWGLVFFDLVFFVFVCLERRLGVDWFFLCLLVFFIFVCLKS